MKKFLFIFLILITGVLNCTITKAENFDLNIQPSIESELGKDILGAMSKSSDDPNAKSTAKNKKDEKDDLITFSARNISIKDAFATLARISSKSISVGSDIRDDETIAVIEIQDQTFEDAFYSLIMQQWLTTQQQVIVILLLKLEVQIQL